MSFIDFRLLTTMRVYRNEDPLGYDKLEVAYGRGQREFLIYDGRGPFAFERFGHDDVWGDYVVLVWDATAQAKKLALWLLLAAAVALFFALATDDAHAATRYVTEGESTARACMTAVAILGIFAVWFWRHLGHEARRGVGWMICVCLAMWGFAYATDARAETDVLVFGASKHFQTNGHKYNEANLGLGAEWRPAADSPWIVGGFALRDSLYRTGYAAYGGYRLRHEFGNGWHAEATLRAGYLKDANYAGVAALPSIGFGYKAVTLEAAFIPKIGNNKTPVAVVWARISF